MTLRIETIQSPAAFDDIREPWNDLLGREEVALPYLRHEWLAAWWRGFGDGASLAILLAWSGSTLTAAAPLMRSRRTLSGIPVRAIHSLGMNVGFADLLRDPARPSDLVPVLEAALRDARSDVMLLRGTASGSAKESWIRGWLADAGCRFDAIPRGEYYMDTRDGIESYRSGRPSRLLRGAERRARQLSERGVVRFDRVRGRGPWEKPLEEAFSVSLRSWKAREGSAVGQQPSFRTFLSELVTRFGATDEAELCLLRLSGAAIAFRVGVSDRAVFVDQEIAFDEDWRRYSPGTLVALHSDEALIRSGTREINLGIDFDWKLNWAPSRRGRVEWIVYRKGSPGAAVARIARGIRARMRREAARA
jgi:CelD/BcsL family acetyltransferase involved in cellulose biosynthesis